MNFQLSSLINYNSFSFRLLDFIGIKWFQKLIAPSLSIFKSFILWLYSINWNPTIFWMIAVTNIPALFKTWIKMSYATWYRACYWFLINFFVLFMKFSSLLTWLNVLSEIMEWWSWKSTSSTECARDANLG